MSDVQLEAGWFLGLGWIWEPSYSREHLYCPWAKSYFLWVLDWSSQVIGALWTLFLSKRNKKASTGGSGFSDGSGNEDQSIYGASTVSLFVCKAPYKALSISSSSRLYAVLLLLYPFHRWEDWGFKRLANIRIPAQMRGEFLAILLSPIRAQILLPSLSSSGLGHMTSILWASVSFLVKMENIILNSQGRLRKATKPPVWYIWHTEVLRSQQFSCPYSSSPHLWAFPGRSHSFMMSCF